jgi:hypothetical protein
MDTPATKTKEKSDEFIRFEDLARKLVSVPKKDVKNYDEEARKDKIDPVEPSSAG